MHINAQKCLYNFNPKCNDSWAFLLNKLNKTLNFLKVTNTNKFISSPNGNIKYNKYVASS